MALTRVQILRQILVQLGPEKFNRLIETLEATQKHGRLRYWQEQLFKQCKFLTRMPTLNEYLQWFSNTPRAALPPSPPLTRETFLSHPSQYWNSNQRNEVHDDWFREAWKKQPGFRKNLVYELIRDASKLGTLAPSRDLLSYLRKVLTKEQIIALFKELEDHCGRRTREWRPEFEAAFSNCVDKTKGKCPAETPIKN